MRECLNGGHDVIRVAQQARLAKFAFALAQSREIETQNGKAAFGEIPRDTRGRNRLAPASEAMGEYRDAAMWLCGRKFDDARQIALTSGKGETFRLSHGHASSDEILSSARALMQNRRPLGSGPSGNTCPRCASQTLQVVSIRVIP